MSDSKKLNQAFKWFGEKNFGTGFREAPGGSGH